MARNAFHNNNGTTYKYNISGYQKQTGEVTFFSMRGETVRVTHVGLSVTDASGQLMFRMSAAVGYLRVMNITGTLRWTCFRGTWT